METVFVVYKIETFGQYDEREQRPKMLLVTKFRGRAEMWQRMGEKLGVEVYVEEMQLDSESVNS